MKFNIKAIPNFSKYFISLILKFNQTKNTLKPTKDVNYYRIWITS